MKKALVVVLALVTGCGAPLMAPSALAPGASTYAKRAKSFRFGLGCKLDGLQRMVDDESGFATKASLPEKVDLRAGCSPVSNQGQTNACVGFAIVDGLGEYLAAKQGRRMNLSPRYLWNLTRQQEKTLDENVGTWPRDAMKIADNLGMALEADFPTPTAAMTENDATLMPLVNERPSNAVVARAKKNRLFGGFKAVTTVHAMKKALSDGLPVPFAINVFENIGKVDRSGLIPMPGPKDDPVGGHEILCVGYDNARRVFIIRNSWGADWGDKGYGYLPYEFFKTGNAFEGFTAKL